MRDRRIKSKDAVVCNLLELFQERSVFEVDGHISSFEGLCCFAFILPAASRVAGFLSLTVGRFLLQAGRWGLNHITPVGCVSIYYTEM